MLDEAVSISSFDIAQINLGMVISKLFYLQFWIYSRAYCAR